MSHSRIPAPVAGAFVGRERELSELQTALATVQSGRGTLHFVYGEAGIGKTRLAGELERSAERRGQRVHWGRCLEGSAAPAFWPWVQVLRGVVRGCSADFVASTPASEWASLTRLLPELGSETSAADAAGVDPAASAFHVEIERFQLFDGLTRFLRRVAEEQPFGIVLDDLHAADPPSLLLLEFVARQLSTLPLWLLGTYREIEAHADPQRRALISTVTRLGRPLSLKGFSEAEVGRLIEIAVGEVPTTTLRTRICDLTAGNPFFVDEVARLLWSRSDPQASAFAELPVPSGVRETVRQRLRPLGEDCLRMLQVAAAIGAEVGFTLLREATGSEAPRLLDLIQEAMAIGVLIPLPERRYAFGHALMRETLYDDLPPSRRVELHRRIAEALEQLYPAALDEHLPEIAFHYARVAPASDAPKALSYAERAARRAASMLAYEDAARLYELALDTLPFVPDDSAAEKELELLLALGNAQVRAADSTGARRTFERAAVAARSRADAHGLARAALGCGGLGLGVPPGTVDRGLVRLLEEALASDAGAFPVELRARLLARLGLELYFSDATARRQRLMDEASALASASDDDTRAYVLHARLVGSWDLTPPAVRLQRSNELIALAEALRDPDLALRGHSYRLLEIVDTGIPNAWEPELEAITTLAEQLREPRFLGMVTGTRAMRSVWLGRFDEAEALGQQAIALAQSVSDLQIPISVAAQTFFMRRLQGKSEEVEMSARGIVAAMPSVPGTHCMLALALCDLQQYDEARREIAQLGDVDFDLLRGANRLASLVPWLAEVCAALGDVARMHALERELVPLAGRNISLQARVCFGPASFYLGLIATGLRRFEEAVEHFDAARNLAQRLRGRPLEAMIDLEQGRALAALGRVEQARELFARARDLSAALGLHALVRRAAALESESERAVEADAVEVADAAQNAGGGRGRVVPFPRRTPRAAPPGDERAPAAAPEETSTRVARASLRREGSLWTIAAGGVVLRSKSSKGLHYLAHLLRHPGKSFHALELMALTGGDDQGQSLGPGQIDELGLRVGQPQLGEPIADAKALAAYRNRIEDLATELSEATQFNDTARRTRLQTEIDLLSEALASAVGIGGRGRASGSFAERARLNVTRAIRSAIARIGEGLPDLGRHLDAAIRTGTFCSYAPAAGQRMEWDL